MISGPSDSSRPLNEGNQIGSTCGVLATPAVIAGEVKAKSGQLLARGETWEFCPSADRFRFRSEAATLDLPAPSLRGLHQHDNAGIAIAATRAAALDLPEAAIAAGLISAVWPARLERLRGRLANRLPVGFSLWLDGGHNPGAGAALAEHLAQWRDQPLHLIVGMKEGKDIGGFLAPLLPYASTVFAVAEPGQHLAAPLCAIIAASAGRAVPGPTVASALAKISRDEPSGRVLICGSLYLAGEVLKQDAG